MISNMSTDVIYARVPSELKQAAEDHAAAKGFTLTAAVTKGTQSGTVTIKFLTCGSVSATTA